MDNDFQPYQPGDWPPEGSGSAYLQQYKGPIYELKEKIPEGMVFANLTDETVDFQRRLGVLACGVQDGREVTFTVYGDLPPYVLDNFQALGFSVEKIRERIPAEDISDCV